MIENIQLTDTGKNVNVSIDNEKIQIPIKSIIKAPTYIELNKSLNTSLGNNIVVDATLYYNTDWYNGEEITPPDTSLNYNYDKLIIDGIANVKIYDNNNVYYNIDLSFTKGHIHTEVINDLPLGEYQCDITYLGNKYFQPYTLLVNFNIEKRLAYCKFDKTTYTGELTSAVTISGTLMDADTDNIIKRHTIKYDFNGQTYAVTTNERGTFTFNAIIPDGNILHCNYMTIEEGDIIIPSNIPYQDLYDETFIDDDGNIILKSDTETFVINQNTEEYNNIINEYIDDADYPADNEKNLYHENTSYLISFIIDDDTYYLNNENIIINVIKAPTTSTVNTGEYDTITKKVPFYGYIMAKVLDDYIDVHYGRVQIYFPDFDYMHDIEKVDFNGTFTANINMADVYNHYNVSDIDVLEPYQAYNGVYDTSVVIDPNIYENNKTSIQTGEPVIVECSVKTITNELVTDGMIYFSLYKVTNEGNSLVYEYGTELDNLGIGVFSFNTSRSGTYKLKAEYIGLFGYNNSINEINIKVED